MSTDAATTVEATTVDEMTMIVVREMTIVAGAAEEEDTVAIATTTDAAATMTVEEAVEEDTEAAVEGPRKVHPVRAVVVVACLKGLARQGEGVRRRRLFSPSPRGKGSLRLGTSRHLASSSTRLSRPK